MKQATPDAGRYHEAGVDIDKGNALVERIKPLARATRRRGTEASLGGFGALFDLKAAGFDDPILVSTTDGVGTKLLLAAACGRHATIGIDLVAMCVNDLVVQGAEPLLFLDYFATGKLDVDQAAEVVAGIARGCELAGCALVGGETAEMPGMYDDGHYDLAGFAVGAAERGAVLPRADVRAGDIILGLASSGLHSNGFSLVRLIVAENGCDLGGRAPFAPEISLGEALLTPTRIYVRSCLAAVRQGGVKAMAHITGGGLLENVPRALPRGLTARIDTSAWPLPPVFTWLKRTGRLATAELGRTFNSGIGMTLVVAPDAVETTSRILHEHGETVFTIGRLEASAGAARVELADLEASWA